MLRSAAEHHSQRRFRLSPLPKRTFVAVESLASEFERGRNTGGDHASSRSTDRRHVEFLLAEQTESDERQSPTVRAESDEIPSREENASHRIESDERKRRTEKSIVGEKYFGLVENAANHQEEIVGVRRGSSSDQHAARSTSLDQPEIVRFGNDDAIADFCDEKTNENRNADEQEETQRKSNRRRTIRRSGRSETQVEFGSVE